MARTSSSALHRAGAFVFSVALVLAISFAIAWPLWSLATGSRLTYTIAVAAALAAAAVLRVASGLASHRRGEARKRRSPGRRRAP